MPPDVGVPLLPVGAGVAAVELVCCLFHCGGRALTRSEDDSNPTAAMLEAAALPWLGAENSMVERRMIEED